MKLHVNLGKDSYDIIIEKGALEQAGDYIKDVFKGRKIAIISDDNVFPLYGISLENQLASYDVTSIVIPHGEPSKNFEILPSIYSKLLDAKLTRSDLIIALGGGVIGDLAGFVASTYLRGVKFIQMPTSLLAQVDSSVGGKVAVDLPEGKNLVGAFKHPLFVLIDPLTLKTLDPHFITDGMGEVIKYGCIKDRALFDQLKGYKDFKDLYQDIDEIIYKCVDIKRDVVEKDLFDFGDRLCLNFGHTIGHAIEQYYNFSKYSHGEAVAIGMVAITKISEASKQTKEGTTAEIEEVLTHYHLPLAAHLDPHVLLEAISHDKKNFDSQLSFVLLDEIGSYKIYKGDRDYILQLKEV